MKTRTVNRAWSEEKHPRDTHGRFTSGTPGAGWLKAVEGKLAAQYAETNATSALQAAHQRGPARRQAWADLIDTEITRKTGISGQERPPARQAQQEYLRRFNANREAKAQAARDKANTETDAALAEAIKNLSHLSVARSDREGYTKLTGKQGQSYYLRYEGRTWRAYDENDRRVGSDKSRFSLLRSLDTLAGQDVTKSTSRPLDTGRVTRDNGGMSETSGSDLGERLTRKVAHRGDKVTAVNRTTGERIVGTLDAWGPVSLSIRPDDPSLYGGWKVKSMSPISVDIHRTVEAPVTAGHIATARRMLVSPMLHDMTAVMRFANQPGMHPALAQQLKSSVNGLAGSPSYLRANVQAKLQQFLDQHPEIGQAGVANQQQRQINANVRSGALNRSLGIDKETVARRTGRGQVRSLPGKKVAVKGIPAGHEVRDTGAQDYQGAKLLKVYDAQGAEIGDLLKYEVHHQRMARVGNVSIGTTTERGWEFRPGGSPHSLQRSRSRTAADALAEGISRLGAGKPATGDRSGLVGKIIVPTQMAAGDQVQMLGSSLNTTRTVESVDSNGIAHFVGGGYAYRGSRWKLVSTGR